MDLSYYTKTVGWKKDVGLTFNKEEAYENICLLSDAGYSWLAMDGINILEQCNDIPVDEIVKVVGSWITERELRMSSFHYAGPIFAPLDTDQTATIDNLIKSVNLFGQWHPKAFVIHPLWIYAGSGDQGLLELCQAEINKHGYDAVEQVVAENLTVMANAASELGINLALENLPEPYTPHSIDGLLHLVDLINLPNVGCCIDAGHLHMDGRSVPGAIRAAGLKLFETHFHDNRGVNRDDNLQQGLLETLHQRDEHMPPGFGTIPWVDVIYALEEIKFEGPVTFEANEWPADNRVEGYKMAMNWWRMCETLAKQKKEIL